jgi:hypothetical protein
MLVLQELRHRDAERERRQRQVVAFEAQRRQAEQEADDEAEHAGDRHRGPVRVTVAVHQDCRRVRADRVERTVAERDLAVVAGQDVEAEQRDRVDQHERELEGAIAAQHERQRERRQQQHREADQQPGALARRPCGNCADRRGDGTHSGLRPASPEPSRTGRTA